MTRILDLRMRPSRIFKPFVFNNITWTEGDILGCRTIEDLTPMSNIPQESFFRESVNFAHEYLHPLTMIHWRTEVSLYKLAKELAPWPLNDCGLLMLNRATCTLDAETWRKVKPVVSYHIDLNPLPPIAIPQHLTELLPSEKALQEMELAFPGASTVLISAAQTAHQRALRTPEQVAADDEAEAKAMADAPFMTVCGRTGQLLWELARREQETKQVQFTDDGISI